MPADDLVFCPSSSCAVVSAILVLRWGMDVLTVRFSVGEGRSCDQSRWGTR